ncbi:M20 family metallopeptidase [Lutibacter sp. B2]|nr:M20 family metallopeptidase [Lutibacter sp. B2]
MDKIYSILEKEYECYIDMLTSLVNIDCKSTNIEGVNEVGNILKEKFQALDGEYDIETIEQKNCGNHLLITKKGKIPGKILLIGHMDTVFPKGTVEKRSFRIEGDSAFGPGVSDMKCGITSIYFALKALHNLYEDNMKTIQVLFNSDEEISSINSREYIEKYAGDSEYVLVMEAGRMNGNVVTSRKGISKYALKVYGKATHAGGNHHNGCNAIVELSNKVVALSKLTDYEKQTTINVGIIHGGSASNVVPNFAEAMIDVRTSSMNEAEKIDQEIRGICKKSNVVGTSIVLEGGMKRPPMEKKEGTEKLYNIIKDIGENMGVCIGETFAGGVSDANFTSCLGIPTIDGLGPVGGGCHSEREYLDMTSIIPRTGLVVELLSRLSHIQ